VELGGEGYTMSENESQSQSQSQSESYSERPVDNRNAIN
jgi:hypothetical protein